MKLNEKIKKVLLKVQKPGRYVGGERNVIIKDKNKIDVRFMDKQFLKKSL